MGKRNCSCDGSHTNESSELLSDDATIPAVLWSTTAFIFFVLCLNFCAIRKNKRGFLDNNLGKLVFAMAIFSSIVTQFCTVPYMEEKSNTTVGFNIALVVAATAVIIAGCKCLFKLCQEDNLGFEDRGMGFVTIVITALLLGLELGIIIMVFRQSKYIFGIFLLFFFVQKLLQTLAYFWLRRSIPRKEYERGAPFYFKFLALVNFTWWLSNISFADITVYEVSNIISLKYIDDIYRALLIDYRLLCALLFLEHSFQIEERHDEKTVKKAEHHEHDELKMHEKCCRYGPYTFFGVCIGLVCLAFELAMIANVNGVHLCPMISDVLLTLVAFFLLKSLKSENESMLKSIIGNNSVNKIELMVMSMGAISIVYLLTFGILSLTLFRDDHHDVEYEKWSAAAFFFRGVSLPFLLLVFLGIPVSTMESKNSRESRCIYFLVSALFVGLVARFVGCILDELQGEMHDIAHHHLQSTRLRYLQDLFQLGPLFHLAACLHLSLHFFLMLWRLFNMKPNVVKVQAGVGGASTSQVHGDCEQGENSGLIPADQRQRNGVTEFHSLVFQESIELQSRAGQKKDTVTEKLRKTGKQS